MISPEYDFKQFLENTKKKDVDEIIYLADQEAVEAWRRAYRSRGSSNDNNYRSVDYQNKLKNLIYHMRSSLVKSDSKIV
jgi:hypothetical protein